MARGSTTVLLVLHRDASLLRSASSSAMAAQPHERLPEIDRASHRLHCLLYPGGPDCSGKALWFSFRLSTKRGPSICRLGSSDYSILFVLQNYRSTT
ncbi:hypothetical protein ZWY2020_049181 [Hordeum vulgare]|nr:hypothetical protein ZWY2020_049181 [Hordeum vulgare]